MIVTISQCLSRSGVEISVPENPTPDDIMKAIKEQVDLPYDIVLKYTDDDTFWVDDTLAYIEE